MKPAGWARINYVRDLPDGRRFANDSRGFLYRIDSNNQPQVYANLAETFPRAVYNRLSSGFIAFTFHPEFARNGLIYTIHAEHAPDNPATPNFIPPGYGITDSATAADRTPATPLRRSVSIRSSPPSASIRAARPSPAA